MTHRWLALGLAALLFAAGCGPKDGVLSYAFALEPASVVVLPGEAELGAVLNPLEFGRAKGRCTGNPPAGTLELTMEGLPPLGVSSDKAHYRFIVYVAHHSIQPLGRLLRALSPIGTAYAHDRGAEVTVADFVPDALGRVKLQLGDLPLELDKVVGGRVDLIIPLGESTARVYRIFEGELGNIAEASGAQKPPPAAGGHAH